MSLKAKYNFLHLFYWFTGCCINGFIAVFLQSKGLSNTEIGIVTGGSCVATIFLSPFMSSLISKIKGIKYVNSTYAYDDSNELYQ